MIQLREYDPDWPRAFERAAAELRRIEPGWLVEHLGSTSVPDLVAKPVIDLAIRVADRADVDAHANQLESEGWV
ncbi:MAG: GrpB family protein, partial [Leifsonia sp.]